MGIDQSKDNLLIGLSKELQKPYWDTITVEKDLNAIWQSVLLKAQKIQETHSDLSMEEAKRHTAAEILDNPVTHHPAVVEYFVENKEFGVLKHLCPIEFDQQLKICLGKLEAMCKYGGDDYLYFNLIETACLMFNVLDADGQKEFQMTLDPLLASSNLSFTLFLSLLPLASQSVQQQLIGAAITKWKQDFLFGLQSGNLGLVHDALFWLAHRQFFALIKEEFPAWEEITPYVDALSSIESIPSINKSLEVIVRENFNLRMKDLAKELITSDSPLYPLLKSIEDEDELGSALRKLHLLEQALQQSDNPALLSDMQLILAIESGNLEVIEKILKESPMPWQVLSNGDTLVGIATQLAVLAQKEMQEKLKGDISEKVDDRFYIAFHRLMRRMLPQENWMQVIDVIAEAAFRSNGVFIGKKSSLFFGKWEAPELLYNSILKIYLPKDEQCLWKKYCINPNSSELGELMLDAYQGGAETYGLWFHLMQKVLIGMLQKGHDWQGIYHLLGYYRKLAGLFLNNIQVPKGESITLATRIQQEEIDKIWPGSPLNFGVPDSELNVSHTTMLNEIRSHYLEKTASLILKFKQYYSAELGELQSFTGHFRKIGKFDFNGREFLVCPTGEDFSYAITAPFEINGNRISGIHILWGWPSSSTFFYAGHLPKKIPNISIKFNPIWVHPSGIDKQKMLGELSLLFSLITKPIHDAEEFEQNLARFFYLFSQAVCYKRGSASIGLVLLSAILTFHGQDVPDAPPPPFFLDCEAMCTTQEEFIAGFTIWLLTGNFEGND